jgi:hypothetical protein
MSATKKILQARFARAEIEWIENWRREQRQIPNVAEALRTLVFRGLGLETEEPRTSRKTAA